MIINKKGVIIFGILLIILSGFLTPVYSAPALPQFIISDSDYSLSLDPHIYAEYPIESNFSIYLKVENSTGCFETNETSSCSLRIIGQDGEIITTQNMSFTDGCCNCFKAEIGNDVITEKGNYLFSFFCNSDDEDGYLTASVLFNKNGESLTSQRTAIYLFTLSLIFVILSFCGLGAIKTESIIGKFAFIEFGWFILVSFITMLWLFLDSFLISLLVIPNILQMITYILWGLTPIFVILSVVFIFLYALSSQAFNDLINRGLDVPEIMDREGNAFFRWFWRQKK